MPKRKLRKAPAIGSYHDKYYNGKTYRLDVVNKDGAIAYRVGKEYYHSPSGAAKAIVKQEVNGWRFWGMDK